MRGITRKRWIVALWAMVAIAGIGGLATVAASPGDASGLQEGGHLLDQAAIGVEDAIAAAREVASGDVTEVELEMERGQLIFEVELGGQEVTVDAATGAVLGTEADDDSNEKDDDDSGEKDHDD